MLDYNQLNRRENALSLLLITDQIPSGWTLKVSPEFCFYKVVSYCYVHNFLNLQFALKLESASIMTIFQTSL